MPCSVPYCSNIATTGVYFFKLSATIAVYLALNTKKPRYLPTTRPSAFLKTMAAPEINPAWGKNAVVVQPNKVPK
jgi:hypothetical protein